MSAGTPVHTSSFDSVFVTATDVASTNTDKIDGVTDLSMDRTRAMTSTTYLGEDTETFTPGVKTKAFSLSADLMQGSTVQAVLKSAHDTGAKVWLTIIEDSSATAGSKGFRYPVTVESYSEKFSQGNVVKIDSKLALARGAVTAV